jgi:glycosyltransferase involved in cell wall biosynthesis
MNTTAKAKSNRGRPLRILYCESNSDGTVGGSHRCLLNVVESLDRSRFEPYAMFCQEHALMPSFRAVARSFVLEDRAPVRWGAGSRSFGRVVQWPVTLARRGVNAFKAMRRVIEHVHFLWSQRIGLVHLNNSITRHHDMMAAAIIAGVPVVCHERGLPSYSASDRRWARRLSLIIPMSNWIRDRMVEQGVSPQNIQVMYDGLDAEAITVSRSAEAVKAEWHVPSGQPVIGMIGNIRSWKGQETVVRALIDVVSRGHDVVCLFVGASTPDDQSYVDHLNVLIRDAGIERNCRFTGYQTDVPSLVAAMDFVIHASIDPEPFGMVVLEAMGQRKAVIGSRAGGVTEMVVDGETGFMFLPGDAPALADHIVTLLEAPERAVQMGERAYHRVLTRFTLRQYMAELESTYDSILSRKRRRDGRIVRTASPGAPVGEP